ncbi:unnamed protein product, partial [Caenorhabditis auriculariae]
FIICGYELRNISSLEETVRKVEAMRGDPIRPDLLVILVDDSTTDLITYGSKLWRKLQNGNKKEY